MCGIYGLMDPRHEITPSPSLLARMGRVVVHRGPDDEGSYFGRGVALGMRRLSIVDVAGGQQPIANETETIWVVCNGEIYNFPALRAELEARGHVFRCNSDTEVIVHLYEEHGVELFRRLRGMFALAIWDAPRARLVLGRDRLGKKPLYVRREPRRILFASEIKSILQAADVPRRVDPRALREYLALGYVPAPWTLFEGIEKVLPGHYLVIEDGRVTTQRYWDVAFDDVERGGSEDEWAERIRHTLLDSVRVRMMSDVPLGAFLSGGIDSSSIVAAMAQLSGRPVKTYSIGFEGRDRLYNELPFADAVARTFGTEHHQLVVRPRVSELLPKLVWHLDEPIADSAFITTYLVSRLARESVTVVLSGVGGDEVFGGYYRYLSDGLGRYYRRLPGAVRARWLPALLARLPHDRHSRWKNYVRLASAFARSAALAPAARYAGYVTLFSADARQALLQHDLAAEAAAAGGAATTLDGYFARCDGIDALNRLLYVDLKTSLPDDLLALTDKMSMAASVECRAPFVDHELIELASRIPPELKIRGVSLKYLLKKAVKPWLPEAILGRRKRGFGAPIGAWLRHDLRQQVVETLSPEQVRKRGFFDPRAVEGIVAAHHAERADHTDHLLALISFEWWCRIFLDGQYSA